MEPYCTEETPSQSQLQSSSQPQPQSQPSTLVELVELVVCRRNNQLYRKGEESKDGTITGRELQPQGYHAPRLLYICERGSSTRETHEQHQRKAIAEANPKKGTFNAYVIGDEHGAYDPKISVSYFKINFS